MILPFVFIHMCTNRRLIKSLLRKQINEVSTVSGHGLKIDMCGNYHNNSNLVPNAWYYNLYPLFLSISCGILLMCYVLDSLCLLDVLIRI